MDATAVAALLDEVRPPSGHAAAVAIICPDGDVLVDSTPGAALFEFGSLTKPLTATLLAVLVGDGGVSPETTVGDLLGSRSGNVADLRLVELATHTSGLPRLAPNAMKLPFWPRDPYRFFTQQRLLDALHEVELKDRGRYSYSNFGFQLLGYCLDVVSGKPLNEALSQRVLHPLGMAMARCQPCSSRGLSKAKGPLVLGGRRWHTKVPGDGGVDGTLDDLAALLRGSLLPETTPIAEAIRLTQRAHFSSNEQTMGLGWHHSTRVAGVWHNGATGRYQSMVVVCPDRLAVGVITAHGAMNGYSVDGVLTRWVRENVPA